MFVAVSRVTELFLHLYRSFSVITGGHCGCWHVGDGGECVCHGECG